MNALNLDQELLVCSGPFTDRSRRPGIVATRTDPKNPAQLTDLMICAILPYERVLYWRSLAKYATAFFRMSRSSLTALSSCLKRLSSLISSREGLPEPSKALLPLSLS